MSESNECRFDRTNVYKCSATHEKKRLSRYFTLLPLSIRCSILQTHSHFNATATTATSEGRRPLPYRFFWHLQIREFKHIAHMLHMILWMCLCMSVHLVYGKCINLSCHFFNRISSFSIIIVRNNLFGRRGRREREIKSSLRNEDWKNEHKRWIDKSSSLSPAESEWAREKILLNESAYRLWYGAIL